MSENKKNYSKVEKKDSVIETVAEEIVSEVKREVSVVPRKPTIGSAIANIFGYLGAEIIVPAFKDIIVNSFVSGINMAVYGDDAGRRRSSKYGKVNYTSYSSSDRHERSRGSYRKKGQLEEFDFEYRDEAREVLESLISVARKYKVATVADYYDLIGIRTEFIHNNYGWSYDDLLGVNIRPVGRNYTIALPSPRELSN